MVKSLLSRLICCVVTYCVLLAPLRSQTETRRPLPSGIKLVLEITVISKRYCSEFPFLHLYLSLRFKNHGDKPILLDSRSKLIGQVMVSRKLKDAAKGKYLQNASSDLDFTPFGYDPPKDLTLFSVIKPEESYSTKSRVELLVRDGDEGLLPGKYFLQVEVITWHYHPDSIDQLRNQWQQTGFLWTKAVTSEPMVFEVESKPLPQRCISRG